MKQIQKLEYLTLGVFAVSVFSLKRPDINGFMNYMGGPLYIGGVPYPEAFPKNFSAIWFIILPALAYMHLLYVKSKEDRAMPMLWIALAILVINIVLAFNFIPSTNLIQPSLGLTIQGFVINCLTVYAIAFSYCCSTQRFGITRFFYPTSYNKKRIKLSTSDPRAYKMHYQNTALICGLSALALLAYSVNTHYTIPIKMLGPILLFFGVLKAGNLELVEKE